MSKCRRKARDYVRSLSFKRIKGAGNLFCIKSASYIVTANQNIGKGVTNGTTAVMADVVLKDHANFRLINQFGQKVYAVHADEVQCLIFKHTLKAWETTQLAKYIGLML